MRLSLLRSSSFLSLQRQFKPLPLSHYPFSIRSNTTTAVMSRRSVRNAAIPKYTEPSDDDLGAEVAAPEPKATPKKRVSRAVAAAAAAAQEEGTITKIKSEEKENIKVKASPRQKKADGTTEVDVSVEAKKSTRATAKRKTNSTKTATKDENEEKVTVKIDSEDQPLEIEAKELEVKTKGKRSTKRKIKDEDEDAEIDVDVEVEEKVKKVVKKRKTKEEKEAEAIPIASRTDISTLKLPMYFGAHVSSAGGVNNSTTNATFIGANAFALFLKSQRKWVSPPLTEEAEKAFVENCKEQSFDAAAHVLPHGSYLVNLAQKEQDKAGQAYDCFLDDLQRCEKLGIKLYNFHPGNTGSHPRAEAIGRIAAQLNRAHKATKSVITVLENMAGQGNVIGSTWEDLRDIIALIEDKSRVGVCIDTCHAFAAGYDLRTAEAFKKTMDEFNEIVGAQYLKALHLNDSKTPLSSNRDLHANIGTGFLGLRAFWNVVNYPGFQNIPMILETPIDKKGEDGKTVEDKSVWANEIKMLERLVGADFEVEEWKSEEQRLQDEGASEREKFAKQVEKKKQKTLDDMFKKAKKGKKDVEEEPETDDEEGCSHS